MLVVIAAATAIVAFTDAETRELTLLGALGVALIAAFAADARQARQLGADAERQDKALKTDGERQERALDAEARRQERALVAEGERSRATLEHARELADLADLRALLDEAAVALHAAGQKMGGVLGAYMSYGRSLEERAPEVRQHLNEVGHRLDALDARLAVRVGRSEDVGRTFRQAVDATADVSRALAWLEDDDAAAMKAKRRTIQVGNEDFTAAIGRFVSASVAIAGTARPRPPSTEGEEAPLPA